MILDVKRIEDISPIKLFGLDDMLSYQLDDNMVLLLEKMCDIYDDNILDKYLSSINVILKAVCNLNLLEDNSEDYILYNNRISYLLNVVLSELNVLSIQNTIKLRMAILEGSYSSINVFSYIVPNISHILLLSMNSSDIKDYVMYGKDRNYVLGKYEFKNGEVNLKLGEVFKLIMQNKWETSDVSFDDSTFKRLSLKKSYDMTSL